MMTWRRCGPWTNVSLPNLPFHICLCSLGVSAPLDFFRDLRVNDCLRSKRGLLNPALAFLQEKTPAPGGIVASKWCGPGPPKYRDVCCKGTRLFESGVSEFLICVNLGMSLSSKPLAVIGRYGPYLCLRNGFIRQNDRSRQLPCCRLPCLWAPSTEVGKCYIKG